jgi:hypothetical protein
MPKVLFYAGTAFCLFLALTSAGEVVLELGGNTLTFVALPASARAQWAIAATFAAGLAIAALFLRMAALLAARNLFAAFVAVLAVTGATSTLAVVLLLQWRMAVASAKLAEVHFAALMAFGFFVALSLLSLRPYFSIQASRFLSVTVVVPLPLFALLLAQEMFVAPASAPLPGSSPASEVFFAALATLFLSIAVHCIRHRHLFLEMTNLRELLDSRADPTHHGRPIGGVAFDS